MTSHQGGLDRGGKARGKEVVPKKAAGHCADEGLAKPELPSCGDRRSPRAAESVDARAMPTRPV